MFSSGKSFASVGSTSTSIIMNNDKLKNKYSNNLLNDDDNDENDNIIPNIFKIYPSKITLQPNTAIDFKIYGKSKEEGTISEIWECSVIIGRSRKKAINIFKSEITANFLKPLIEVSNKKIYFQYLYEENILIKPLTKQLKLTNISLLPLIFMINCPMPFSVDRLEYSLNPNQETIINVSFDPVKKSKQFYQIMAPFLVL